MTFRTHLLRGAACTALIAAFSLDAGGALAQSTGTQVQEIVVTGMRDLRSPTGLMKAEQLPKARSSISDEFIKTQPAGQSVIESLNLLPGVSFTNNDAYGSSGGNLRLRGFDGPRVGLLLDGIPLPDSGNYAIFTNQMMDPEVIGSTTVNQGTTDVDSPTASAAGGIINILTRKPREHGGVTGIASVGSEAYERIFASVDTGVNGGVGAYGTFSDQFYKKFKGPGDLKKAQVNGRFYEDLGNGDFVSLAGHFNRNRNNFYRNLTKNQIAYYGRDFDNLPNCVLTTPGAGAQNDGSNVVATTETLLADNTLPAGDTFASTGKYLSAADNPVNPNSCSNFYGLAINPSNTGNLRGAVSYGITDNLRLTIDPSFQYVLANGGGTATIPENDARLRGTSAAAGIDLNGDGDTADTIRLLRPSNTNTRRYGVNSSLIWDVNEHNRVRFAYTVDYAQHRQTGEFGFVTAGGPQSVWGGKDGNGTKVATADGSFLRNRDRYSVAELNQVAADYRGEFGDLTVQVGVRAPFFYRRLHQFCYTQNGNGGAAGILCTTQVANPTAVAGHVGNGLVQFANLTGTGFAAGTEFVRPFRLNKKYDKVLPNLGVSYTLWSDNLIYFGYGENFSAPKTDNLYAPFIAAGSTPQPIQIPGVQPETSKVFDLGWRYQADSLLTEIDLWKADFQNRIVTSFDQTLGVSVDRNIGNVNVWGVDAEAGWTPLENLALYGSVSYNHSEVKSNIPTSITVAGVPTQVLLPTAGKKLVETPDWTYSARAQYEIAGFQFGLQGKFVGKRFSTDVNDDTSPSYVVANANVRYNFQATGAEGVFAQINVLNLFDKDYLAGISSTNSRHNIVFPGVGTFNGLLPTYTIPSPRTFQFTLGMDF